MARGIVVIDPGHGGNRDIGGSSKNNAVSPSGVLEKNLTLVFANLVGKALEEAARIGGHDVKIFFTRKDDVNLALSARAAVAKSKRANVFLSIHFNGFNGRARGTETLVSPRAINSNHAADKALAQRIQTAAFNAVKALDSDAKNRGVKDQRLGVLNEASLGTKARGCLLEVEFLDVRAVDRLLNISPNRDDARAAICKAVAGAIINDLIANP